MAGPIRSRLVEVWVGGERAGRYGSGYLVSEYWVLTAAHVVGEAEGCEVRCLGQVEWAKAQVVWQDLALDMALVHLAVGSPEALGGRPLRWGRVLGGEAQECVAVGFPESQQRPGRVRVMRDTEQLIGTITPLSAVKSGRLVVHVRSSSPKDSERWRGMSGAGLFVGEVLVGVLCAVPGDFGWKLRQWTLHCAIASWRRSWAERCVSNPIWSQC